MCEWISSQFQFNVIHSCRSAGGKQKNANLSQPVQTTEPAAADLANDGLQLEGDFVHPGKKELNRNLSIISLTSQNRKHDQRMLETNHSLERKVNQVGELQEKMNNFDARWQAGQHQCSHTVLKSATWIASRTMSMLIHKHYDFAAFTLFWKLRLGIGSYSKSADTRSNEPWRHATISADSPFWYNSAKSNKNQKYIYAITKEKRKRKWLPNLQHWEHVCLKMTRVQVSHLRAAFVGHSKSKECFRSDKNERNLKRRDKTRTTRASMK